MTDWNPPAPAGGERVEIRGGRLAVRDQPILPFIEGAGTGPDIWNASQPVFDAAVEKAYGGQRRIRWTAELAGGNRSTLTGTCAPDAALKRPRSELGGAYCTPPPP